MHTTPVTWSERRKVETYVREAYVSRQLKRHCSVDVDAMLQRDLEAKVERLGYVPLPDTFTITYMDHRDPDNPPWWVTAEERQRLDKSDAIKVRMTLRCYKAVR